MDETQLNTLADSYVRRIVILTVFIFIAVYCVAIFRGWRFPELIGIGSGFFSFGIGFLVSIRFLRLAKKR